MSSKHQKFRHTTLIFDNKENCCALISRYSKSSRILVVDQSPSLLSLSDDTKTTVIYTNTSEINQYLGQEFDCILFDAAREFNVNAFTAISGCLIGGGELIVNLPSELAKRLEQDNILSKPDSSVCPLLERFVRKILAQKKEKSSRLQENDNFIQEQNQLIKKIERCALGHAKRPLVITANRGRGKSAALGIAAAKLIKENNKNIIVTAPRKANVKIFFQHLHQRDIDIKRISFIPPDELIREKPKADLIIVDEAGAIPVQILEKIAASYNRIIFSTTTDGYEGNGQGFEIRFKSKLAEQFPQWRSATLNTPMRWMKNDPLEAAINDAFMLSFKHIERSKISMVQLDINYQLITKLQLLADEELLKQIYTLLVEAHYQTRPSDLQKILSDKSMQVFIALNNNKNNKTVVATALVCAEGSFSDKICQEIEQGKKRIAGHLLPQSLMAYQGDTYAGKLSFWRIMRVAVTPEFQRKKVGSQLIQYIVNQAKENSVELLGASFSLTKEGVHFWYQLGFKCTRLALRKDSSTGSYPGEFMKPISITRTETKTSYTLAITRFQRSFYYSLSSSYAEIELSVLLTILEHQINNDMDHLPDDILTDISRYIEKARSFEMVEWQINQLILFSLTKPYYLNLNSELTNCVLLAKSLQHKTWKTIVKDFEFDGKKTAKEAVREAVNLLVKNYKPM